MALMNLKIVSRILCSKRLQIPRLTATYTSDNKDLDEDELEAIAQREAEINKIRNKSGLISKHYNIMHNRVSPLDDEIMQQGLRLKTQRRIYAAGGKASNINHSICWPSLEEMEYQKEYEKVLQPLSVQEMIAEIKRNKIEKEKETILRQADIKKKLKSLDGWKKDLNERITKKETEARLAQENRIRRMEEVRQIFGYNIDPKDSRFIQALEDKELEERKAKKAGRKIERQKAIIEELKKAAQAKIQSSSETPAIPHPDDKYGQTIATDKDAMQPPVLKTPVNEDKDDK